MKDPFSRATNGAEKHRLDGKYKKSWVETALDIDEGSPRLAVSHTNNYLGSGLVKNGPWFFLTVVGVGCAVLVGRIGYLQIARGSYYRGLAEGNRIRVQAIPAERGIIYDRWKHQLVQNVPNFALAVVPQDLPRVPSDRAAVVARLTALTGLGADEITATIDKYSSYRYDSIILKENLPYDTALRLYTENGDLPGVIIEDGSKRNYPDTLKTSVGATLSLSHILGYTGRINTAELSTLHDQGYLASDNIGRTGLEKSYESALRGTYGRKQLEVDAFGREQSVLAVDPPTPGKDIILSLDVNAQRVMETAVKQIAEKFGDRRIAAVALNPNDGEILALVSWPAFDNNDFAGGISQKTFSAYQNDPDLPLFNRAISGVYPPGSTVKLVVSAAALQEKVANVYTAVLSTGGLEVGGHLFKDWKVGGHGLTNILKAIAWSVNTFFYYVGGGYQSFVGLGINRLDQYFHIFQLGEKTGIDLPGEQDGFIPTPEWKQRSKGVPWFVGDTYNVSIGQGDILVNPLEVARWTAAVANNGTLVQPHLGRAFIDPVTKTRTSMPFSTSHIDSVSAQNLAIVRQGMRQCVADGSCGLLAGLPFLAAGKTGTAQWSQIHPTHAWFTSFAPYDKPQIVVTVLVESGGEGSTVAMPIARDFLAWWGKKYLTTP